MSDLISREEAQDAVTRLINEFEGILGDIRISQVDDSVCGLCEYDGAFIGESGEWCNECPGFDKEDCFALKDEIRQRWTKELPQTAVEKLADKEQRIFLAAMVREEKVCEEVDRNYVREPYEDSLMRVCKEIRRKVKGALWT